MLIRRCVFLMLVVCASLRAMGQDRSAPNFVLILVDDQAWNATAVPMQPGNEQSRTPGFVMPNLARIAKEGMVFSQAYAAHPKCECSRASLQMGRSTTTLNAVDKWARNWSAPASESIANCLKRASPSYRAAHFGKWQWPQTPESMGFDASDGITQNEDGDTKDPMDPKQSFGITRRAVEYMTSQVGEHRPFFLQLSYYAVHSKPQALEATLKKYQQGPRSGARADRGDGPVMAAMTEDLDSCIGRLLATLKELGIEEKTYVIYMADNGMRSSALKGGKALLDEGGIRVPLVVRGPGVKRGDSCDVPVVAYDILPTMLDLVNPSFELPKGVEGGSWKQVLRGTGDAKVKRPIDRIVWHHDVEIEHPQTAMRQGDLKLIHYWDTKESVLYDIRTDPAERLNLALERSKVLEQMLTELKAHVKSGLGDMKFAQLEQGRGGDEGPGQGKRPKPRRN